MRHEIIMMTTNCLSMQYVVKTALCFRWRNKCKCILLCGFLVPFGKRRRKNGRDPISPLRYWRKDCTAWICNSYRMSARGAWIGNTWARGNVNTERFTARCFISSCSGISNPCTTSTNPVTDLHFDTTMPYIHGFLTTWADSIILLYWL